MFSATLTGEVEVSRKWEQLTVNLRDKYLKRAVNAGLKPMRDAAQSRIGGSGILRNSIDTRVTSKGAKGETVRGYIGPRRGVRIPVTVHKGGLGLPPFIAIPSRYAHLVEFGHKIVVNGKVIGTVAPHPFMRPAWEAYGGDVALARVAESLQQDIAASP